MIKQLLLLPLAALAMAAQSAAPLRPEVPVMVGGDSEQDACGGTYRVTGLNPRGDNFLSVRSRPAAHRARTGAAAEWADGLSL